MTRLLVSASLVLASLSLAPSNAVAQDNADRETLRARISFADLDLRVPADRIRLERRVSVAIRRMCAIPGRRALSDREITGQCMQVAGRDAEVKLAALMPGVRGIDIAVAVDSSRGGR